MYKSNTQKREEVAVVADLIVPGTSSIVRILVSSQGNTLPLSRCGIRPGAARASIGITIIFCANSWKRGMSNAPRIFADRVILFRDRGFWPRPNFRRLGPTSETPAAMNAGGLP